MIEFVEKPEEKADPFQQYFQENIVPLVEAENKIKNKYRGMFWGYFFSVVFLMSANLLLVLFLAQMKQTPISLEQLLIVNCVAFAFVFLPIYRYNRLPKNDIFDVFLRFYGNWKHLQNSEVKLVHSPIIPAHDAVGASHNVVGKFDDISIEMRDTFYTLKSRRVSSGVILYAAFLQKVSGSLLLFDRKGFYRKNKFPQYEFCNKKIDIPAANYFNIFASDDKICEQMMHNLFFEDLLNLKEAFAAEHVYVQIENNYMRVYLEGSRLYIDNYKFWCKKVEEKRFLQMHKEFETAYLFVQTIKSLKEQK